MGKNQLAISSPKDRYMINIETLKIYTYRSTIHMYICRLTCMHAFLLHTMAYTISSVTIYYGH